MRRTCSARLFGDWMRDVWREEFAVGVCTLYEGIVPKDGARFEQYSCWR